MKIQTCFKMALLTAGRRKKTIVYGTFVAVVVFAILQVTYFNQNYSPLQVLSDARSEARRLLKFISLYHYQCNNTLQWINNTNWPVCLEKSQDFSTQNGDRQRVMFSIGPTGDCALERVLALNYSFDLNVFYHDSLPSDFIHATRNKSQIYRTSIVPNDPADFARNSYDTETLNNIFQIKHFPEVDILKIETLADQSHAHELLYYLVKDHQLAKVKQLHLALYIDKVDDDYLYSWYRSLYMLFNNEGFRLYHSSASDSLCLQVTLMESCIYYMSWIKDPGPQEFILYPPAIDGSDRFEIERLLDYLDDTVVSCGQDMEVTVPAATRLTLCMDLVNKFPHKPCHLVIMRDAGIAGSITAIPNSKCSVTTLEVAAIAGGDLGFSVKHRRYERSTDASLSLQTALSKFLTSSQVNLLYIDLTHTWDVLTHILDSGTLYNVGQVILEIRDIWGDHHSLGVRRKYSELKRLEAYGFRKYQINEMESENKLTFHSKLSLQSEESNFKLNYLKSF